MRQKEITLSIDPTNSAPIFRQVADGLIQAIVEGRLTSGASLPSIRYLSERLDLSVTPIIAAFELLKTTGWIEARDRSGYLVSRKPPTSEAPPAGVNASKALPAFDLPTLTDLATSQMERIIKLSAGIPDPRLMPSNELGTAFKHVLRRKPGEVLNREDPQGLLNLREALASFLESRRGLPMDAASIVITRGNRMALNLLAKVLLRPGDLVAVEDPGNPAVWESFKQAKVRLCGLSIDEQGLRPEAVEELLSRERLSMLYVTPRFQMPTTVTLAQERREHLLRLAKEHGFLIIEEDSEADYIFDGTAISPLAASKESDSVIYLSTFSRLLAPGVRLGMLAGPPHIVAQLAGFSRKLGSQGDPVFESAVAELLMDGEIHHHIQWVKKEYRRRRTAAVASLRAYFGPLIQFEVPSGGLSFWIQTDPRIDLSQWSSRCADRGILFQTGSSFALDRRALNAFRLGFGACMPEELDNILQRMRDAMPTDSQMSPL